MKRKIVACLAPSLWMLSLVLSFSIKPGSSCMWVPDTLLLLGFVPCLVLWKHVWTWIMFGLCNIFIGCVLEVARFLPDQTLPGSLLPVRQHLAQMHVGLVWILVGAGATIYGVLRIAEILAHGFFNRLSRKP